MTISRDAAEHRRRVLEHQQKVAAKAPTPSEPQLRIPLIAEVKRAKTDQPPKSKRRRKTTVQPRLDGIG
jgi:hypothetical protein